MQYRLQYRRFSSSECGPRRTLIRESNPYQLINETQIQPPPKNRFQIAQFEQCSVLNLTKSTFDIRRRSRRATS